MSLLEGKTVFCAAAAACWLHGWSFLPCCRSMGRAAEPRAAGSSFVTGGWQLGRAAHTYGLDLYAFGKPQLFHFHQSQGFARLIPFSCLKA